MTPAPSFSFDAYVFAPGRQLLLRDGEVVRVGCRALDLLAAFVQRPGEVLTKNELIEEAWPSTTVVEGNLKVHIAALRRALNDDVDAARYIATVNGRGYRFIAPVKRSEASTTGNVSVRTIAAKVEPASAPSMPSGFEEALALLARTMRSGVIELPDGAGDARADAPPRRVLFVELTPRDEAWIEDIFAKHLGEISATR